MIAFLLLILLVAILAYFDARREKRMIDARPGGPDLDHKELVWRRLRNVGALVMVAVVCDGTEGWDALWMGLCHAAGAWAMFVLVHRMSLNLMRGVDWRYTNGSGNSYDHFWARLVFRKRGSFGRRMKWKEHGSWVRMMIRDFPRSKEVIDSSRRAGTLAYIFEITVLAASIVGVVAILN